MKFFKFIAFFLLAFLHSSNTASAATGYVANLGTNEVTTVDSVTLATSNIIVGNGPDWITITPDGMRAYVANSLDNTVSVVDTTTNLVIDTIPVGIAPMEITPDGTQLYVTNPVSDNVSVISTLTNTVIATITVGSAPLFTAITPDGTKAYVVNNLSNNVSVIDTATHLVIATIPTGVAPQFIILSLDGTKGYVLNSGNTATVISTVTNTAINTITVGSNPVQAALTPDGTKLYVANKNSNNVSVINTLTDIVTSTVAAGTQPTFVAITADGATAYVANILSSNVTVINTATDIPIQTIVTGSNPRYIAITPDQTEAFVVNAGSNNLSVIDIATNTVIATVPVGLSPRFMVFNGVPQIISISPDSGPEAGGTVVTITGLNFIGTTQVFFGLTPALSFIVNSDGSITAVAPPGVGIVNVRIVSNHGTSPITPTDQYTYLGFNPAPPFNFIGRIKENKFLNLTELALRATWIASPSTDVILYKIFRNNELVAVIPATSPLVFITELDSRKEAKGFVIVAVNSDGLESIPLPITIVRSR